MAGTGTRLLPATKSHTKEMHYDIGNFPSYFETFIEFARAHPPYGGELRERLEYLLEKSRSAVNE
jgi:UTP-glucose-1-phosphate uridylyltransferase